MEIKKKGSTKSKNWCPICEGESVLRCKCMRSERKCANNHWWHKCSVHHTVVIGKADHAKDMNYCTCKENETLEYEQGWQKVEVEPPPANFKVGQVWKVSHGGHVFIMRVTSKYIYSDYRQDDCDTRPYVNRETHLNFLDSHTLITDKAEALRVTPKEFEHLVKGHYFKDDEDDEEWWDDEDDE